MIVPERIGSARLISESGCANFANLNEPGDEFKCGPIFLRLPVRSGFVHLVRE
jgi:hypothetical protein